MSNSIVSFQAYVFLLTVGTGILFGLLYDCIRVLRRTFPHGSFVIQIQDLVYWIMVAWFLFFILFHNSYGEIRGFSLLGVCLGAGIYYLVVSPWFMKVSVAIVEFISSVVRYVYRIVSIPVRWVLYLLSFPYQWIQRILGYSNRQVKRYGRRSIRYSYRRAQKTKKNLSIIFRKV